MRVPGGEDVSPFDRLVWPEGVIEALLASGERRRELTAFLGDEEYMCLRPMAVAAAQARKDPDRCVFIVPGIMGSQLGLLRPEPLPANVLWVDPADFERGNLAMLALPGPPVRPLGPVLHNYLPLKLALEATGLTVRYFDYDWRRDIDELGGELATRLAAENAKSLAVVGHSMGGLVGRAALAMPGGARVNRLLTLGAPHGGSFATLQALRGVYPLVRRVAQLDPQHSPEQLASLVFSTFPSLYQMLPTLEGSLNLFDATQWPASAPRPDAAQLARAAERDAGAVDDRIACIAGYGRDTVCKTSRTADEFRYHIDRNGDGTVPVARAVLPRVGAWYCDVGHSDLPRSSVIHAALINLLAGRPADLRTSAPLDPQPQRVHTDSELRAQLTQKIDWSALDADARRHFLDSLNEAAPPLP